MFLLLASLVLAVFSWRFIETPFRKRAVFNSRIRIFSFGSIATILLLAAGLAFYKLEGVPSRVPAEAIQYAAGRNDLAFIHELDLKSALAGEFIELGAKDKSMPVALFVWGDSHAMAAMPILDILCKENALRGVAATRSATTPLVGYEERSPFSLQTEAPAYKEAIVEFIRNNNVRNVLLIARWDYYIDLDKGTDRLRSGVLETINALQDSGATIWIIQQVPKLPWNVPHALASVVFHGGTIEEIEIPFAEIRKESQRQHKVFEGLGAQFPNVAVLDPAALFTNSSGRCRVAQDGKALFRDSNHLTVAGAMLLRPLFEAVILNTNESPAGLVR